MKPRVFISSTYYDLKYLRERIEKFLTIYGFDTVLFESNNVTYEHGRAIDLSVYRELEMCHMMILVVGGRYGSAISSEKPSLEDQKKYDEEYVSITRKEFETASQRNIPIFIFIDKNVYSDYENYIKNIGFFDKVKSLKSKDYDFQFAHVDSLNIFKFINSLIAKPVKTFENVEEIESYLQSQLAGMFYLYLESLQKKSDDRKILNSVEELNNITKVMSEMLDSVGKKILGEGNAEYEEVIDKQFDILLDYFVESLENYIYVKSTVPTDTATDRKIAKLISKLIYDVVLKEKFIFAEVKGGDKLKQRTEMNISTKDLLNREIKKSYPLVEIDTIDAVEINENFHQNVKLFIKNESDFMGKILEQVEMVLYFML